MREGYHYDSQDSSKFETIKELKKLRLPNKSASSIKDKSLLPGRRREGIWKRTFGDPTSFLAGERCENCTVHTITF